MYNFELMDNEKVIRIFDEVFIKQYLFKKIIYFL